MPIYIGDYIKATRQLSLAEHGAYFLIMMELWEKNGEIPLNTLNRIVSLSEKEFKNLWVNLSVYFQVNNGMVSQKRLTKELNDSKRRRAILSANGAKGGRPKNLQVNQLVKQNDNQNHNQNETSSPSPSQIKIKRERERETFLSLEAYQASLHIFRSSLPTEDLRPWLDELRAELPKVDIPASIRKILAYWESDAGYATKKKAKIKTINWKSTVKASLHMDFNQISKPQAQPKPQNMP